MGTELILAPDAREYAELLGYRSPAEVLLDSRGRTIRCTPGRRTTVQALPGGRRVFRKLRSSRPARAMEEWANLGELRDAGFLVPQPLMFARRGGATALAFLDVPGRPLDVLIAECERPESKLPFLTQVMALSRRLHAQGYCYRDLYWAHLFAMDLDREAGPIAMVDVERVFKPRWRRRRWLVKDLASLLASWPAARPPRSLMLRLLRAYLGDDFAAEWKGLGRSILRRAEGIRARRPRFGDMGFGS